MRTTWSLWESRICRQHAVCLRTRWFWHAETITCIPAYCVPRICIKRVLYDGKGFSGTRKSLYRVLIKAFWQDDTGFPAPAYCISNSKNGYVRILKRTESATCGWEIWLGEWFVSKQWEGNILVRKHLGVSSVSVLPTNSVVRPGECLLSSCLAQPVL